MSPEWTCPFCSLLCDDGQPGDGRCPRADAGVSGAAPTGHDAAPFVDGRPATWDAAIAAAAAILRASRQPLLAGPDTDVAGARALYPLACAIGAITDPGAALMHGVRALQDRGQYTTTITEAHTRADLVVVIGAVPTALAPRLGERLALGDPGRRVVVLGAPATDPGIAAWRARGIAVQTLAEGGDLFATLARLPPALWEAARAARYSVWLGAPALWPAPAALLMERIGRIVNELNAHTRAAALWVGAGAGAATANQVFAWLSGLPLRSRAGPWGLEHEPQRFDARTLIDDGAVDALLWVHSLDPAAAPPASGLPLVALAPPLAARHARRTGAVFLPVAVPGLDAAGHLFRTDGTVLLPVHAMRPPAVPGVAELAMRLLAAVQEAA